jgi:hypothetical protein
MRYMSLLVVGEFVLVFGSALVVGLIEHNVGWGFFGGAVAVIACFLVAPLPMAIQTLLRQKAERRGTSQ